MSAAGPDWDRLEADVVERIRALRAIHDRLDAPPEWRHKVRRELILPSLRLLAEFCAAVRIQEETP